MKQPIDISGGNRKTLLKRKARPGDSQPAVLKKATQRRRILKKGSDADVVKAFGEK